MFRSLILASLLVLTAGPHVFAADRPNVLMIAIDDLNDWVGCLGGHPQASTPNIDRLAQRGVLFTNAHCQAPICNPSRTSVMLGLRPSTTGIYLNSPWFRQTKSNADRITLPQYFAKQGYKTLTTGKIYHGSRIDGPSFQTVGPRPGQRLKIDKQIVKDIDSKSRLWDFGPQEYAEEQFGDFVTATWARGELAKSHDKPFFLATGFYRPHVPFYAPTRFFDPRPLDSVQLPIVKNSDRSDLPAAAIQLTANSTPPAHEWFVSADQWKPAVQAYLASVSFTDSQVGRLLDALDASPYRANTIVVLFSDHGFHLGEKQRWAKQSLWERSTRVPLIISVPQGVRGRQCPRPVELLSLFPTLVELCGLPARKELEGVSLKPLLSDPMSAWNRPAVSTYNFNNHSVRSERYRYIRYGDGSEELYDHQSDSREWNNLAADNQYSGIKKAHAKWLPEINVPNARARRNAQPKAGTQRKNVGE